MIKIILLLTLASLGMARPEPPVNNLYLPPVRSGPRGNGLVGGHNGGDTSATYGVPDLDDLGNGGVSNGDVPSTSYGVPLPGGNGGFGSSNEGLSEHRNGNGNSAGSDGVPGIGSANGGVPSASHGASAADEDGGFGRINGGPTSSTYGAPGANEFGNGNGHGPSSTYGAPGAEDVDANNGVAPSEYYGTPVLIDLNGLEGNGSFSETGVATDKGDHGSSEPAKYVFSYEVNDPNTGTAFGHSESRDGDHAQGQYNVILPDGRKQIVEYEANQGGYQPQIRYEDASGAGGLGGAGDLENSGAGISDGHESGGNGVNGGYPSGGAGVKGGYPSGGNGVVNGYTSGSINGVGSYGYPSGVPNGGHENSQGY